ncbi:MAG: cysteine desulfurase [Lachnospiraceae bacterium]|jgi:cysteine desulfurase|nr:cysteine desulfurase [Lachnospiraceae bacterium]
MEVYLDNSATTCTFTEAADLMHEVMCKEYGNPSSMHMKGVEAERYVSDARKTLAGILKVNEKEIFFTSGGTESDNWALIGTAMANNRAGKHIITTKVEHPAILRTTEYLQSLGFEITYLPVDEKGFVRIEDLERALRRDTILVSMMYVNNEVGAKMPVEEAGAVIKRFNPSIVFHVDAVQGFGKFAIHPKKCGIDLLSVSGHKIHGPKGIGFLYINEKVKIKPIHYGGGQQKGMRSGTENVPGIAGLAKASELIYQSLSEDTDRLYSLREMLVRELQTIPDVMINGPKGREGAPHIVSASFMGIRSEVLLHALEDKGVYVSAGSACAAKKHSTSETLKAMHIPMEQMDSTLRFSFSIFTTTGEIEYTMKCLREIVPMLRRYTRR